MENESQRILMPQEKKDEKPPVEERPGIIEAILFVAGDAVDKAGMCKAMSLTESELDEALDTLESLYDFDRRGLRLLRFGAHVQLATRPDYAVYVENILQPVQRQSLSQAIMETLAVIAYKQPVTKAEVEQIRGVKCDYSVQSLIAKGLIIETGRKEALGRPILYGTTDAFLRHFCISSLDDLPEIDFAKLARKGEGAADIEEGTFDLGTVSTGDTVPAPAVPADDGEPDAKTAGPDPAIPTDDGEAIRSPAAARPAQDDSIDLSPAPAEPAQDTSKKPAETLPVYGTDDADTIPAGVPVPEEPDIQFQVVSEENHTELNA